MRSRLHNADNKNIKANFDQDNQNERHQAIQSQRRGEVLGKRRKMRNLLYSMRQHHHSDKQSDKQPGKIGKTMIQQEAEQIFRETVLTHDKSFL